MYLYSFSHYIGQDRVFWCELPSKKVQAGDVLQSESDFFLVLGEFSWALSVALSDAGGVSCSVSQAFIKSCTWIGTSDGLWAVYDL